MMNRVSTNVNRANPAAIILGMGIKGLGIARFFGRRLFPVYSVASNDNGNFFWKSRYLREVWRHEPEAGSIVDTLLTHVGQFDEPPVLFPTTDALVQELAARRLDVSRHCRVRLPENALITEAMSKRGFAQLAAKMNMTAPRTFVISEEGHLQKVAGEIQYPCVIKPDFQTPDQSPKVALKVGKVRDAAELTQAYRALCPSMPVAVVQEWIPGGDSDVLFCLQYYGSHKVPNVSFCGQKTRQWPPLGGNTASCKPLDHPQMEKLTTDFFAQLGIEGLCSMEFKRDPRDGTLFMVEPTIGRTDVQSAVADINGVPIPYIAYCDQAGLALPRVCKRNRPVTWVRWSADRASAKHYRRCGELNLLEDLWSLRPPMRTAVWSLRDPAPSWESLRSRLIRKARRLLHVLSLRPRRVDEPTEPVA